MIYHFTKKKVNANDCLLERIVSAYLDLAEDCAERHIPMTMEHINFCAKQGQIIALIYITYFTQPISFLSQVMQIMQSAAAAGDRIFAFLKETELTKEHGNSFALSEPSGQVTFEHAIL